jgi:hypothetical protein
MSTVVEVTNNANTVISVSQNQETGVVSITGTGPQGIPGAVQSVGLTSTGGTITVTGATIDASNTSGTFSVDLPQSVATTASPTFASLTLNDNLAVSGTVTGGTYNGQTISSAAAFTGTASIAGNASVGGTLSVTGAVTGGLYNGQTISSAASLTGTLAVAGAVTVNAPTSGNALTVNVLSGNYGLMNTAASGTTSAIALDQNTVVQWAIKNQATSGLFSITSGGITGSDRLTITSGGQVSINEPDTAVSALTVTSHTTADALTLKAAGNTTNGTTSFYFDNSGNSYVTADAAVNGQMLVGTTGTGSTWLITANTERLGINSSGAVTINAPTSGNALTVSGALTGGTYNGQTISSAASLTGTLAVASNVTVGGSVTLSGGKITGIAAPSGSTDAVNLSYLQSTYLPLSGGTLSGGINFNSNTLTNLPTPVNGGDAANKQYVDNTAAGLTWKQAVKAATTANLTGTYVGSPSFTLTNSGTQAAFSVDGYSANAGDRILVKNQTTQSQNGIYTVTTVGSASTNWVLTRASDFTEVTPVDEVNGAAVFTEQGTAQANTGWTQIDYVSTFDTDPIAFVQFTGGGGVSYLSGTANQIAVSGGTGSVTVSLAPNVSIPAPASGTALTVNGSAGTSTLYVASGSTGSNCDIYVTRTASTANTVGQGPNVQLTDTSTGYGAILQFSGGQTELWQADSAGGWNQALYIDTSRALHVNSTTNINSGGSTGLQITTSSSSPYAIEFTRSDISNTIGFWNNAGTFQFNAPISTANNVQGSSITSSAGSYYGQASHLMMNDNNDGWLRLNNASNFGNGVYTPGTLRCDGAHYLGANAYITASSETYGTVQIGGLTNGGYYGYGMVDGRQSMFMSNSTDVGIYCNAGTGSGWIMYDDTGTTHFSHSIVSAGTVTGSSDIRLKRDVETITGALGKVKQLTGVAFTLIKTEERSIGLVAQDVERVVPEAVRTDRDGFKSIAYGNLAGLLVEAIKELESEVATIRARVETLQ